MSYFKDIHCWFWWTRFFGMSSLLQKQKKRKKSFLNLWTGNKTLNNFKGKPLKRKTEWQTQFNLNLPKKNKFGRIATLQRCSPPNGKNTQIYYMVKGTFQMSWNEGSRTGNIILDYLSVSNVITKVITSDRATQES